MKKTELIIKVEEIGQMSRSQATVAVESVFQAMAEAFLNKEDVTIREFATFKVKEYAGKKGYNMSAGETVVIPPTLKVKMKLSKELQKKINKKK